MAVIENTLATAHPLNPIYTNGKTLKSVFASFTPSSATDVYVLATGLTGDTIVRKVIVNSQANESVTDFKIGAYEHATGKELSADAIVGTADLSEAQTNAHLTLKNANKSIKDSVKAKIDPIGGYDLCAKVNATGEAPIEVELVLE